MHKYHQTLVCLKKQEKEGIHSSMSSPFFTEAVLILLYMRLICEKRSVHWYCALWSEKYGKYIGKKNERKRTMIGVRFTRTTTPVRDIKGKNPFSNISARKSFATTALIGKRFFLIIMTTSSPSRIAFDCALLASFQVMIWCRRIGMNMQPWKKFEMMPFNNANVSFKDGVGSCNQSYN